LIPLILIGSAFAEGPTVIYPGDDASMAVTRVAATTKLDADSIKPVTLSDITVGEAPVLFGPGTAKACGGVPSTMSALRGAVERAEGGVAYMEFEQAKAHLKTAVNALACLKEPVHPETGSRLHYLNGILLHASGNSGAASIAFKQAHHFQPGLTWDDYFPPDSKDLFDAAGSSIADETTLTLAVVPAPAEGALWIDGRAVTAPGGIVSLTEGNHLVQVVSAETITVRLNVVPPEGADEEDADEADEEDAEAPAEEAEGTGESEGTGEETAAEEGAGAVIDRSLVTHTLVVPTAVTNTDLTWADEDGSRQNLEIILSAALGEGGVVYIPLGATVWTTTLGSGEWTALEVPTSALVSRTGIKRIAGQSLFWGGAGIAAGSGLYGALNYIQAVDHMKDGKSATSWEAYSSAQTDYDEAQGKYTISAIIFLSGAAMTGGGWFMERGVAVTPYMNTSASGLQFTWTPR
jgi:hypothetical protein